MVAILPSWGLIWRLNSPLCLDGHARVKCLDEVVKRQDELHARYLSDWQPMLCGGALLEVCQEPVETQDGRGPKKGSSAAAWADARCSFAEGTAWPGAQ